MVSCANLLQTHRLILILVKTKWYISPSAGQAWDDHQHVYQDYEHFIHNIASNIILTKHSLFHFCSEMHRNSKLMKKPAKKIQTIPTSDLWPTVTLWPLCTDLSVGGLTTDQHINHESTEVAALYSRSLLFLSTFTVNLQAGIFLISQLFLLWFSLLVSFSNTF